MTREINILSKQFPTCHFVPPKIKYLKSDEKDIKEKVLSFSVWSLNFNPKIEDTMRYFVNNKRKDALPIAIPMLDLIQKTVFKSKTEFESAMEVVISEFKYPQNSQKMLGIYGDKEKVRKALGLLRVL